MTTLVLDRTRVSEPPARSKQRRGLQIAMLAASGVVIAAFSDTCSKLTTEPLMVIAVSIGQREDEARGPGSPSREG